MIINATFWIAISFFIFIGVLIYLKVPQKVNDLLTSQINRIKKELDENDKNSKFKKINLKLEQI